MSRASACVCKFCLRLRLHRRSKLSNDMSRAVTSFVDEDFTVVYDFRVRLGTPAED